MRTWRLRQPYGSIGLQERLVGGSGRPSGAFWAVRAGVTCEEPQTRKSVHQVKNTFFAQIAGNGPDSVLDWSRAGSALFPVKIPRSKRGPPYKLPWSPILKRRFLSKIGRTWGKIPNRRKWTRFGPGWVPGPDPHYFRSKSPDQNGVPLINCLGGRF